MITEENGTDGWLRNYLLPRRPELVALFLEAREICSRVVELKLLAPSDAERLLSLVRNPHSTLSENVASMIGEGYAEVPALGEIIRALSAGRAMHERVNALVSLSSFPTTELHSEVFGNLLKDRSARVRELAADKIVIHWLKGLVPELEEAANCEPNPRVAEALRTNLEYLRRGYNIRNTSDGVCVSCCIPFGGITSRHFSISEYSQEGQLWIREVLGGGSEA